MYKLIWFCFLLGTWLLLLPPHVESYKAPLSPKEYATLRVAEKWGFEEWQSFHDLIQKESSWNHLAQNPKSSAFGYGQFLNQTWEYVGCEKTTDPYKQIDCTITYVEKRYSNPQEAMRHHLRKNWY